MKPQDVELDNVTRFFLSTHEPCLKDEEITTCLRVEGKEAIIFQI
jgi:hypothetical protein